LRRIVPALTPLLLLAACAHGLATAPRAPGFDVQHGPEDDDAAAQVARILPVAVARAERWGPLAGPIAIRIQPSHAALAEAVGRPEDAWLRAWARRDSVELQSPRTWSRGRASDEALATLIAHELTHCLLFQRLGPGWAEREVPGWFEEGMASFTAGEHHRRADPAALRPAPGAVRADAALAYGTADRAFHHLVDRHGEEAVRRILASLAEGRDFPAAFQAATGDSVAGFEGAFRSGLVAVAAAPLESRGVRTAGAYAPSSQGVRARSAARMARELGERLSV
jgi:hypothetical protein